MLPEDTNNNLSEQDKKNPQGSEVSGETGANNGGEGENPAGTPDKSGTNSGTQSGGTSEANGGSQEEEKSGTNNGAQSPKDTKAKEDTPKDGGSGGSKEQSIKDLAQDVIDVTGNAADTFNKINATVTLGKVTADVASVNEAVSSWEKVSVDKIIGEPLKAAVKAQGNAAKSVLEFIRNVGVTDVSNNGSETMTVVSFNFFKNGKIAKMQIPLITLVPIPTLGINEVTYDFKMVISSSSDVTMTNTNSITTKFDTNSGPQSSANGENKKEGEKKTTETAKAETDASKVKDATKKSVSFSAGYSSKKDSTATQTSKYSVETTMDVKMTIGKDDLPAGVSKMLEILNGSTEIVDPNGELTLSADNLTLSSDGYAILSVSYIDGDGNFAPSAITCTDVDGKKEQGQKVASADSLQIIFTESGVYKVSAGKKCHVVQISPAAKATDS